LTFDTSLTLDVVGFMGVWGRTGGFLMALPPLAGEFIPFRLRLLLAVAVSVVLFPVVGSTFDVGSSPGRMNVLELVLVIGSEFILGAVVALLVRLFIEAFTLAGDMMGIHMGFAFAQQVDPTMNQNSSMMGQWMTWVFLVLFLALDGHLALLRVAKESFAALPPGALVLNAGTQAGILEISAELFVLGMTLSLPVLCMVLFVDAGMAMMTKFGPEFQVLILAFPIRIGLGLFVAAASLPVVIAVARRTTVRALSEVAGLLGL
jgi:flagellar biosynthetic protein FliR